MQNCFLPVSSTPGCIQPEMAHPAQNPSHRQIGLCLLQPPAWQPESDLESRFVMCQIPNPPDVRDAGHAPQLGFPALLDGTSRAG